MFLRFAVIVAVLITLWFTGRMLLDPMLSESRLRLVREEAEGVLAASTEQEQTNRGQKSASYAKLLQGKSGRIGQTATLYLVATAPLGADTGKRARVPDDRGLAQVDPQDLLTAARLMAYTHNLGPADQVVRHLLQRDDVDREMALRLAIGVRYDLGRGHEVLEHCDELSRIRPDDLLIDQMRAMVHRNLYQWEESVAATQRAIELAEKADQLHPTDLVQLTDSHLQLKNTDQAREQFDRLEQRWPEVVNGIPLLHARLLMQEGNLEPAEPLLMQALEKDRKNVEALVLMGTLLVEAERYEEALEYLEVVVHLSKTEERAFAQLTKVHQHLGNEELAKLAAEVHQFLVDQKERLRSMEIQASREPENVEIRRKLAGAYEQLELKDRSEFWERAARAAAP